MNSDDTEPRYVISVAARIVGVQTHTLRYYERIGIIEPSRSRGNIRLYSERDIAPGQCGIFYQKIKCALNMTVKGECVPMYGFISGLGVEDITIKLIEKGTPVEQYLKSQGRYRDLTPEQIGEIQKSVEERWNKLQLLTSHKNIQVKGVK